MPKTGHPSPAAGAPTGVTDLLLECRGGQPEVAGRLYALVYDELRRVAHAQRRGEQEGHTLDTTALVHEAYLRLVDITRVEWRDRVHFLSMAARAMRRVLVDHARARRAERRGGGAPVDSLEEVVLAAEARTGSMVALDEALERLAALSPRLAQVVECRFFGGMTEPETASALGITERTVRRDWVKARGWLRDAMTSEMHDT